MLTLGWQRCVASLSCDLGPQLLNFGVLTVITIMLDDMILALLVVTSWHSGIHIPEDHLSSNIRLPSTYVGPTALLSCLRSSEHTGMYTIILHTVSLQLSQGVSVNYSSITTEYSIPPPWYQEPTRDQVCSK